MAHAETKLLESAKIVADDPSFEELIDLKASIEILAEGFQWSEGPVWDRKNTQLLFSDVPKNRIHAWSQSAGLSTWMEPSGYTGVGKSSGSNGLLFDQKGRLVLCEHGDRRIAVLTAQGGKRTIADEWEGGRFNSPNDLVIHSDGSIYITDPPYGLKGQDQNPEHRGVNGVYRISKDKEVQLLVKDLKKPNGITLSPDEKTLYVAHSDAERPVILSYPVRENGSVGEGKVFYDLSEFLKAERGYPDGLKVDEKGNVWTTGPGGVYVINPDGKLLGRIRLGGLVANLCWGNEGHMLYLTAHKKLLRVKTIVPAARY